MKNKLITSGVYLVIVLQVIFFLAMFYPVNIGYVKQPAKVLTPVVKAGGKVQFEVEYCKNRDYACTVNRILQNDLRYYYTPMKSNIGKGCGKVVFSLDIPEYVPVGKYTIQTNNEYDVNFLRKQTYTYETEMFEVIK